MVLIAKQFNGPPTSGNGGYVSGLISEQVSPDAPARVRLKEPPPLGVALAWETSEDTTRLLTHGGAVVGEGSVGSFEHPVPAFADADEIVTGEQNYPGFHTHPFDHCFTCGTAREPGDGLRIFTGSTANQRVAGPWHAHPTFNEADGKIGRPVTWAALDCPGGWAADFTAQTMLLGTMTAEVYIQPVGGQTYHAVGELVAHEGRKFFTNTALYTPDGDLVGRAEQVWISI